MAAPHAFLDILANPQVRDAYLAGRISIILSADLGTILWANGTGARFMGFRTVAESINVDSGFDRLTCLQIEAGLASTGAVRIRGIPQAQSFLVNVIMIEQLGEVVFLRSVVAAAAENNGVDLIDGLSDETTEAAVLDLSGRVMCASSDFQLHLFNAEELSALLQKAHRAGEVKKRFFAENNDLPVGVLQLSDEPAIFLLIAAKSDAQKNSVPSTRNFVFDPQKLPLRFVWKIDAEGKFTEVSPELREIVGLEYADIIGLSFVDLAEDWQMDRDGAVRALLKSHNAWSGRSLTWPVQGGAARVDVELAALPVYSHAWVFSGFRGFGEIKTVIQTDAAQIADTGRTPAGRLSPQEHEAFSAIARQLKADMFAVAEQEKPKEPEPVPAVAAGSEIKSADEPYAEIRQGDCNQGMFSLLNQLPVAVLVYRYDNVLFINPSFLEMSGYSSMDDFRQSGILTEVLQTWVVQNTLHTVSGHVVPVEVSVQSVEWEDGQSAHMVSFMRKEMPEPLDKTELEALRHRSAQLSTLLNMVSDGVIILDSAGIVASVNEAASRIFGYLPAHMKGQLFSRFFSEKSLENIRLGLHSAKEEESRPGTGDGYEVDGITARGEIRKLRIGFGRMEFDDGSFLIIRDLTRFHMVAAGLVRERNHAQEVSKRKSRYLALVSHEVRTPLNAVIGLSQLMLEEKYGPLSNDRYRNYLGDIVRSGEHIMTLINDLLNASKSEEGWLNLNIRPVSLPAILNEVLGLMMPQANAGRIIIRSGVASDLPSIIADERSVRQILLNLLSNAIRFTPQGGQIIISAYRHQPDEILLRIRDTGVGMNQLEMQQAMKPYRQVEHKDAGLSGDATRGTGLGLPLTKAMVEANHARFILHSEPGKGTIAEITFMTAEQPSAAVSV